MSQRTPKFFDGTEIPGKKINGLLDSFLRDLNRKTESPREKIFQEWFLLIGEKMAPLTRPISFVDEVLTISVKSATLYSLLCQYEKPRLLQQLKQKFTIREIIFRIG